ncbi:phosphorylated adapter RNA export protein isoform X2 [Copidosoma floridanum]|uniref:phosphorylated adapter RNA export protein isoform X2 n=1 Tax=Copidosoma floridanum TaxID=29053 RepID=UPI0006C986F3|nr:phosphorylated adapter RNA export protein isoform X2 [Copidosoma floridanum]
METESLDLEDGEVVDNDDEQADSFGPYKVLQRPHHVASVPEQSKNLGYSDESDLSGATESDSDSDDGPKFVKRPKIKIKRCKTSSHQSRSANDKYKVWCRQVQEESLTEDLLSCGVTKSQYRDRNVESYDYKLSCRRNDKHRDNTSEEEDQEVKPRVTKKRTCSDRRDVKLRLGKRRNNPEENKKGSARTILDLTVTAESTEEDVAADIADKLSEKKDALIRRIVDVLGKQKAIYFFEETKKIEEEGGMLIMNGSRRRTAGGVYLFLVKNDDHIPQPKIREIFYQEKKEIVDRRKMIEASHRNQKSQELMKLLENGSDKDLPTLLNRAELSTQQIAEEVRLLRGEGMDRITIDSERTVTNPPPSPVTDDPDHSELTTSNPDCLRHVQDYSDDFLDLGVEVDMEVF